MNEHDETEPFACPQCPFASKHKISLGVHIRTVHLKIRRYACAHCEYRAAQFGSLQKHVAAKHETAKGFLCHECHHMTTNKSNLQRHISAVHGKERSFACPECDYKAVLKQSLKKHVRKAHVQALGSSAGVKAMNDHIGDTRNNVQFGSLEPEQISLQENGCLNNHIQNDNHFEETDRSAGADTKMETCESKQNHCSIEPSDSKEAIKSTKAPSVESDNKMEPCPPEPELCSMQTNEQQENQARPERHSKEMSKLPNERSAEAQNEMQICQLEPELSPIQTTEKPDHQAQSEIHSIQTSSLAKDYPAEALEQISKEPNAQPYQSSRDTNLERQSKSKEQTKATSFTCTECTYVFTRKESLAAHIRRVHELNKRYRYACSQCKYQTDKNSALKEHVMVTHDSTKSHACPVCEHRASSQRYLRRHMASAHGKKFYFECSECDYKSTRRDCLLKHVKGVHEKGKKPRLTVACSECDFQTASSMSLRYHLIDAHGKVKSNRSNSGGKRNTSNEGLENRTNINDTNSNSFTHSNKEVINMEGLDSQVTKTEINSTCPELNVHEIKVIYSEVDENDENQICNNLEAENKVANIEDGSVGDPQHGYDCNECDYKSVSKLNMKQHADHAHCKPKRFQCSECPYEASSNATLRYHVGTHRGLREHACPLCNYRVKVKNGLRRHIREVHEKAVSFPCSECEFVASRRANLKAHIDTVHRKTKSYECPECGLDSTEKQVMKQHMILVHQELKDYACALCSYKSLVNESLKQHMSKAHEKARLYECSNCEYVAIRRSNLKYHSDMVHDTVRKHECSECEFKSVEKLKLKLHVDSVHLKIKDFACNICEYKASTKPALRRHIRFVHEQLRPFACTECDNKSAQKQKLSNHVRSRHTASGGINSRSYSIKAKPKPLTRGSRKKTSAKRKKTSIQSRANSIKSEKISTDSSTDISPKQKIALGKRKKTSAQEIDSLIKMEGNSSDKSRAKLVKTEFSPMKSEMNDYPPISQNRSAAIAPSKELASVDQINQSERWAKPRFTEGSDNITHITVDLCDVATNLRYIKTEDDEGHDVIIPVSAETNHTDNTTFETAADSYENDQDLSHWIPIEEQLGDATDNHLNESDWSGPLDSSRTNEDHSDDCFKVEADRDTLVNTTDTTDAGDDEDPLRVDVPGGATPSEDIALAWEEVKTEYQEANDFCTFIYLTKEATDALTGQGALPELDRAHENSLSSMTLKKDLILGHHQARIKLRSYRKQVVPQREVETAKYEAKSKKSKSEAESEAKLHNLLQDSRSRFSCQECENPSVKPSPLSYHVRVPLKRIVIE